MTEERQPDEVLRIIARPDLDRYHDYAVHELWLGSFKITSGGKAHCAGCAVELSRELNKHAEQQLAEARAQGMREAFEEVLPPLTFTAGESEAQNLCNRHWNAAVQATRQNMEKYLSELAAKALEPK